MAGIERAYLARVEDVNARDRSIVAKINTAAVDRYRTVIDPRGVNLANYRANPVVLWEHGRDSARGAMPVGRNDWIKPAIGPDGPELVAKTVVHGGKKGDEFTERLFECYRDGDMRAFSVNIVPDERRMSPPTAEEKQERPELEDCVMCYRASDLAEYSLVAVGGNAQALTLDEARSILRCVDRGLALPNDLVKRAKDTAEPEDEDERTIKREGEKFAVYERGKKIAEYDTEEEAMDCKKKGVKKENKADRMCALPPLGGRSLADAEASVLHEIRGIFDARSIIDDLRAQADLARGIV